MHRTGSSRRYPHKAPGAAAMASPEQDFRAAGRAHFIRLAEVLEALVHAGAGARGDDAAVGCRAEAGAGAGVSDTQEASPRCQILQTLSSFLGRPAWGLCQPDCRQRSASQRRRRASRGCSGVRRQAGKASTSQLSPKRPQRHWHLPVSRLQLPARGAHGCELETWIMPTAAPTPARNLPHLLHDGSHWIGWPAEDWRQITNSSASSTAPPWSPRPMAQSIWLFRALRQCGCCLCQRCRLST